MGQDARYRRPVSQRRFDVAKRVELCTWDRDVGFCRFEAGVLDDLDSVGSACDAELAVDRRDVCLDGRAGEVETVGDVLEREMRPQERNEPELGGCESVVLSSLDPRVETLQPGRERSGIGISL